MLHVVSSIFTCVGQGREQCRESEMWLWNRGGWPLAASEAAFWGGGYSENLLVLCDNILF